MKKTIKSILAGVMALALVLTAVGCGGDEGKTAINKGSGEIPEKISIYAHLASGIAANGGKSHDDVLTFQAIEELTGCDVEWIHPAQGAGGEKFNLMLASGELPDMIATSWSSLGISGESYAEDGVIIPLSELIEENMPNLSKLLKERPDIKKQFTEANGEIYYIPIMKPEKEMKVFRGPQIREDWLKKLGLEVPSTPDELYEVFKAFKTKDPNGNGKADEIPMSAVKIAGNHGVGELFWMFGTYDGFYLKDGKVAYGLLEDEYEEGLKYITKLFKEGLIDQDFLLNDRAKMDSKFMNDRVGYVHSYQPTNFYNNMNDGVRKVIGIPYLAKEGVKNNVFDTSRLMDVTNISVAVTTKNPNPAGSLKWLDTFFGEEGIAIYNYGIEGVSYDIVDGEPKYKPEVLENGKINLASAAVAGTFPGIQEWNHYKQTLSPWGVEAIETWTKSDEIGGVLPPMLTFTTEERDTLTQVYVQIQTYIEEKVGKIIIGQLSIDELPAIREQIKKMGIEDMIAIYEAALKRYNSR